MLSFFCSEEGNQAHAKHVFGFTRTYNEKIRKREARLTAKLAGFSSLNKEYTIRRMKYEWIYGKAGRGAGNSR